MSSASVELRAVLVAALRADATLTGLLGGATKVIEMARPDTAHPFVQIRESARANDTTTDYGKQHDVELVAFTRATPGANGAIREGRLQADEILAAIEAVFRAVQPGTLQSAHRLITLEFQMLDVRDDEGGKTKLGYARYRAVTEEI